MTNQTPRSAFLASVRDIAPILIGVFPFGVVVGIISSEVGLSAVQTILGSIFIYAGASQLVMMELLSQDTVLWVIVVSAAIVNLRLIMYSAAMTNYFKKESWLWKLFLSYSLVDQIFAFSQIKFVAEPDFQHKKWYSFGLTVPIWLVWQSAIAAGFFLGPIIPESWSLSFVVPLMFLAMLVPAIKGRAYLAAALVSAVIVMLTQNLPNNLGLMVAALSGILIGFLLDSETDA